MEQMIESVWNGYRRLDFTFMEHSCRLVFPKNPRVDRKWLFKTEYFGAFPAFELAMLERGYHVAHIKNTTRWCLPEDTERQAAFCSFLQEEFGLAKTCMPVGMSCGGMGGPGEVRGEGGDKENRYVDHIAYYGSDVEVLRFESLNNRLNIHCSDHLPMIADYDAWN